MKRAQTRRNLSLPLASRALRAMALGMPRPFYRPTAPLLLAAAALSVGLSVGGCATGKSSFPSLARRPIERISAAAPVVSPTEAPAPVLPDQQVLGQIDAALGRAATADARFHQHVIRTRQLVGAAQGAAIASEPWAVATIAVSDLESSRSDAMIALADLDAIYAKARIEGADTAAVGVARDQVVATITAQDAVLAGLRNSLAD